MALRHMRPWIMATNGLFCNHFPILSRIQRGFSAKRQNLPPDAHQAARGPWTSTPPNLSFVVIQQLFILQLVKMKLHHGHKTCSRCETPRAAPPGLGSDSSVSQLTPSSEHSCRSALSWGTTTNSKSCVSSSIGTGCPLATASRLKSRDLAMAAPAARAKFTRYGSLILLRNITTPLNTASPFNTILSARKSGSVANHESSGTRVSGPVLST